MRPRNRHPLRPNLARARPLVSLAAAAASSLSLLFSLCSLPTHAARNRQHRPTAPPASSTLTRDDPASRPRHDAVSPDATRAGARSASSASAEPRSPCSRTRQAAQPSARCLETDRATRAPSVLLTSLMDLHYRPFLCVNGGYCIHYSLPALPSIDARH
jgi:hypothetical protein